VDLKRNPLRLRFFFALSLPWPTVDPIRTTVKHFLLDALRHICFNQRKFATMMSHWLSRLVVWLGSQDCMHPRPSISEARIPFVILRGPGTC
jgi:hypothetical protein